MKQILSLIATILVLFLLGVLLWWVFIGKDMQDVSSSAEVEVQAEYEEKVVYLSNDEVPKEDYEQDCRERGGEFNECGSPCAADAESCIQVCAFTCEFSQEESEEENRLIAPEVPEGWVETFVEELGVSVWHPEEMETQWQGNMFHLSFTGATQRPETGFFDGIGISMGELEMAEGQSKDAFLAERMLEFELVGEITELPNETTLAGKEAIRFSATGHGDSKHIFIFKSDGMVFWLTYVHPDPEEMGYEEIVEQVLQSMRVNW